MELLILGNGIAGATAAAEARLLAPDAQITMVSDEAPLPFSRPALMYAYLGQVRHDDVRLETAHTWDERRVKRVQARISRIDIGARRALTTTGESLPWDRLLIAFGSRPRRGGWPGEDLRGVRGLYHWQDLQAWEADRGAIREAVVVGGGLIGVELAEMLVRDGVRVTMLVREHHFWGRVLPAEEGACVNDELRRAGVVVLTDDEVDRLEGLDGRVNSVLTRGGHRIVAQAVGICIGVEPNLGPAADCGLSVGRGLRVDALLKTSAEGIFAAGDCAEITAGPGPGRLEQVWYTARAQGAVAGAALAGRGGPYASAPWFNSAKFFDLEYQVYGTVAGDGAGSVLYHDPKTHQMLRVQLQGGRVIGLHGLGIRLRQRACESLSSKGLTLDHALNHLPDLLFQPELGRDLVAPIRRALATRS